jgi:endoglucanase
MFVEDDFRWIRDWGFNFVRLPMDYRFWTDADDLMKIHEQKVEPIDRAIRLGEKYGVHVNICLHRAPGYCSLDQQDPAIGMIPKIDLDQGNLSRVHITVEKMNLFRDSQALEAFAHQWTFFAQRYKGISSERLSFNLVNEPNPPMTPAEREALSASSMEHKDPLGVASEIFWGRNEQYARVARVAIAAIRSIDPQRLIVCDGHGGASPVPDLIDTGVLQSRHDYFPMDLTLYEAEWLPRPQPRKIRITSGGTGLAVSAPLYSGHWPEVNPFGHVDVDRDTIERAMGRWRKLEQQGVRIHFGEMGCYKYTPHKVVLGWSRDTLDAISKLHSGWALRNFRGPFGILDTERQGTKYEDWHGHQLDRALLNLLQKKMKA